MEVPFVDLPKQSERFRDEIKKYLNDVIFTRYDFIMRQDLIDFEKNIADFLGVKYAIGVGNGSDALNLCVKVLNIGPGDEVITVSHTFVATIAAIHHAGAQPVLVDIGADYNIDINRIEEAITSKTKAIIPVHLNGRICDMAPLLNIADKYNLAIIEDSAQAIGAIYNCKKAGSFGILSTNSFYPFKIIGCFGDGGMITTNDSQLDYKLRCIRDNGQDRAKGKILYWGWNSRLDNLQAGILNIMLKHLPELILRRREIAEFYQKGLSNIEELILPPGPSSDSKYFDVYQNYVIRTTKRNELLEYLNDNGIGTLISWPIPTHLHKNLKLMKYKLPNTENISDQVISIPMNHALTNDDIHYIIKIIKKFFYKI